MPNIQFAAIAIRLRQTCKEWMQTKPFFTFQSYDGTLINSNHRAFTPVITVSNWGNECQSISTAAQKDHHQRPWVVAITRYVSPYLVHSSTHLKCGASQQQRQPISRFTISFLFGIGGPSTQEMGDQLICPTHIFFLLLLFIYFDALDFVLT